MKTKLKNMTGSKRLSIVHNSISLVIILIMLFMSLGTIFTLTLESSEDFEAELYDTVYELTGDKNIEISHDVKISFPFFVKAIIAVPRLIEVFDARPAEPGMPKNQELDEGTLEFLVFVFALISKFENVEALENGSRKALVEAIVFVCGMIALLFFSFILVFALLYSAIRTAFGFISIKKKGRSSHSVLSKSLLPIIKLLPMLVTTQLLLPEVKYGIAIWIVAALALLLVVISAIASRLITYDTPDRKYFNALQGSSVLSFVGLIFFLVNLMKTGILNIALVSIIDTAFFVGIPGGNYFSLFFLAFLILLFPSVSGSLKSINRITTKFACISDAKSPIYVASSVGALFAIIVPAAMLPFGESVLYLNPDQFLSFILAAVGAVIMLAAEILLSSLCKKFGPEVSFENRRRILGGTYVFEWVEDTITEPDFELID